MDHEPCVHCLLAHTAETLEITPPIHLSSTNIVPLESEVFEMRQTIHKGRARLSYLEAQITNLQNTIHALNKEHRDVQHQIHNVSGILSPIRRFPAEILGEIFRWTLPTDISLAPPYLKQSPWNISHVSARWRAITVAFPVLWSQIGVRGKEIPIDALKTQLQRSYPHLLTIYFSCDVAHFNTVEPFRLLLDSSERWQIADLRITEAILPALNERRGRFSQLRQLYATTYPRGPPCTAFETAPKLIDIAKHGPSSQLSLPFAQLTRLRIRMPLSPDHLKFARHLVQLTLTKASKWRSVPTYPNPIELPQLRMLMLADGRYLESLILPALEDIYILRHASSLPEFIGRSPCRLKKLTIIDGVDIIPILNRAPTLLEIRLRDFTEIARLLAYLTVPPDAGDGSHTICPELRFLSFCDMTEKDLTLASQMVQSRATPISISVLRPDAPWTRQSTAYPDLGSHMELLKGARAVSRLNSWSFDYPGQGK